MRPFVPRLCLISICVLATACTPRKNPPEPISEVRDYQATFLCDGDQLIHVVFTPFNAALDFEGVSVAMIQQPAADGFRYAGGGQSLRQGGRVTTWTDAKGVARQCREIPAAGPKANTVTH
jgi:hypothetical protein